MKKSVRTFIVYAIEALLYCFASLGMWHLFVTLLQDIGSGFEMIGYAGPHYINCLLTIYVLFLYHLLVVRPRNEKSLRLCSKVNGIILAVLGLVEVVLCAINLGSGLYAGAITGGITALFPLDHMILGVIFAALGGLLFFYGVKGKLANVVYVENTKGKAWTIISSFLVGFFVIIGLFFFGDILYFFYMLDYSFKNFGWMLSIYALCAYPTVLFALYEWGYARIEDKIERAKWFLKASMISVSVVILTVFWYFLATMVAPMFIVESGTALFPGDFMISIKFGPIFLIASTMISTVLGFIFATRREKPAKEAQ